MKLYKAHLFYALTYLALASGLCYAPIKDSNIPADKMPKPQSDALLADQQRNFKVQKEVGTVPENTNEQAVAPAPESRGAAKNLAGAGARLNPESAQAVKNLKLAQGNQIQKEESKKVNPFAAIWWLLGGVAIIVGLRTWVNKQVPEVPNLRKPSL